MFKLYFMKKYIVVNIITFILFLIIYSILDVNANESYYLMIENFGLFITIVHILINILISFISSIVFTLSYISLSINKKDIPGSSLPIIGLLIGLLTFGCTPCVVALLSIFGVTFVPFVLPNANLLWKLLVLLLVLFSMYITYKNANRGCSIK